MNFNLSEEQSMIRDSIARFVQDNYQLDQRNAVVAQEHGFSADHWRQFAELGWLSIPFTEEFDCEGWLTSQSLSHKITTSNHPGTRTPDETGKRRS